MNIGDITNAKGCITLQRFLQGMSLEEIESRLGFHKGRLSKGAYFLVIQNLPSANQFNFAGYSQVSTDNTEKVYGKINDPNDEMMAIKKKMAMTNFGTSGSDRLVKVIPVMTHNEAVLESEKPYPPGSGIPQWTLITDLPFVVECFVNSYPKGRFIPKQGYTEYKVN
jgi:hypothetical protein